jgi:hypothetical protein
MKRLALCLAISSCATSPAPPSAARDVYCDSAPTALDSVFAIAGRTTGATLRRYFGEPDRIQQEPGRTYVTWTYSYVPIVIDSARGDDTGFLSHAEIENRRGASWSLVLFDCKPRPFQYWQTTYLRIVVDDRDLVRDVTSWRNAMPLISDNE